VARVAWHRGSVQFVVDVNIRDAAGGGRAQGNNDHRIDLVARAKDHAGLRSASYHDAALRAARGTGRRLKRLDGFAEIKNAAKPALSNVNLTRLPAGILIFA